MALHQLSERYPRFGYRKVHVKLKEQGWSVGRERVRLLRKQEGVQRVRKPKKRRLLGKTTALTSAAQAPNHVWSYDFLQDQTAEGKRLKVLTVLDEFTREGLALHCARHITSGDVIRLLQRLFAQRGTPTCLKSDNGPEFIASAVQTWLAEAHVRATLSPVSRGRMATRRVSMLSSVTVASIAGCSSRCLRPAPSPPLGCANTIPNGRTEPCTA